MSGMHAELDDEPLVYLLRPARTALWLPISLAQKLKVSRGDLLSAEQFEHPEVQELIWKRSQRKVSTAPTDGGSPADAQEGPLL